MIGSSYLGFSVDICLGEGDEWLVRLCLVPVWVRAMIDLSHICLCVFAFVR